MPAFLRGAFAPALKLWDAGDVLMIAHVGQLGPSSLRNAPAVEGEVRHRLMRSIADVSTRQNVRRWAQESGVMPQTGMLTTDHALVEQIVAAVSSNQLTARIVKANVLLGEHDYTAGPNVIGPADWGCPASLVGAIYSQIRNGIPGNTDSAAIVSGRTYTVYQNGFPVGQVRSYVGLGGLTIANVTQWNHVFYDGWIQRNAYQDKGTWYSVTHGKGIDYYGSPITPEANQILGPKIFNELDESITAQLYAATHH